MTTDFNVLKMLFVKINNALLKQDVQFFLSLVVYRGCRARESLQVHQKVKRIKSNVILTFQMRLIAFHEYLISSENFTTYLNVKFGKADVELLMNLIQTLVVSGVSEY